jgi:hypothetical protein
VPVSCSIASHALVRIAVRSRHIMREAALVNIDKRSPCACVLLHTHLKPNPLHDVSSGMQQSFFYS